MRLRRCLPGQHQPAESWVLRPALVGAGVSIEFVHFDLACTRCRSLARIEWRQIKGDRSPLPETMGLTAWLMKHGATIESPPDGPVTMAQASELERMVALATGNRAQRRAAAKRK